jgi:hypothetical protein
MGLDLLERNTGQSAAIPRRGSPGPQSRNAQRSPCPAFICQQLSHCQLSLNLRFCLSLQSVADARSYPNAVAFWLLEPSSPPFGLRGSSQARRALSMRRAPSSEAPQVNLANSIVSVWRTSSRRRPSERDSQILISPCTQDAKRWRQLQRPMMRPFPPNTCRAQSRIVGTAD